MITKTPSWTAHSTYCGMQIFKRRRSTGSHGGGWFACANTFKTLADARAYAQYYEQRTADAEYAAKMLGGPLSLI